MSKDKNLQTEVQEDTLQTEVQEDTKPEKEVKPKAPKPPKPRDVLKAIIDDADDKVNEYSTPSKSDRRDGLVKVLKKVAVEMKQLDGTVLTKDQKKVVKTTIGAFADKSMALEMLPKQEELVLKAGSPEIKTLMPAYEAKLEKATEVLKGFKVPEGEEPHQLLQDALKDGADFQAIEAALKSEENISPEQRNAVSNWAYACAQAGREHDQAKVAHYLKHGEFKTPEQQNFKTQLEATLKAELAFDELLNNYAEEKDMGKHTRPFSLSRTSDKVSLVLGSAIAAAAVAPAIIGGVVLATEMNVATLSVSGVVTAFETLATTNPALLAGIVLASTLGLVAVVVGLFSVGGKAAANEITGAEAGVILKGLQKDVEKANAPEVEQHQV